MRRIAGLREIADQFDLFLIEQFGVLHDGVAPYPRTIDGLAKIAAYGRKIIILTNSGKCAAANLADLHALGFAGSCLSGIVSSGDVALQCVKSGILGPPFATGAAVCVIGAPDDHYAFTSDDFELVDQPHDAAFLVFAGSDVPRIPLQAYQDALAGPAKARVPAICINPDIATIRHGEIVPAAGAIARLYEDLGGSVEYIGKPHLLIFAHAIATAELQPGARLVMGDSPHHDVAGARPMGLPTLQVQSEHYRHLPKCQLLRLCDRSDGVPDFVIPAFAW